MNLLYTVHAEFDDAAVAAEWVAWLEGGHLDDVLEGGALAAALLRCVSPEAAHPRFEVQYLFPDAARFAEYERVSAPRLRAEGLAKFPPSRGVRMTRSTAEILCSRR